jgi:hypothetical protein
MIKATLKQPDGRTLLVLGLSFGNLAKFRDEPGDTFIKINGQLMDLPIDVLIYSGKTEAHLHELIEKSIGPNTIIHIDPKLKS